MKKFLFSLDRVLDWRRAQARVEEMKLERLYAELRSIDGREQALRNERREAEAELRGRDDVAAQELAALDAFRRHIQAEVHRSEQARAACESRIQAQTRAVAAKRRDVRLFEKLKLQRQDTWNKELDREIARQAEESHLAKWNRGNL